MSIARSCRFLCGIPSPCLLACRLGCGAMVLSSHRAGCVAMSCLLAARLVFRFACRLVGRVGSASLSPSFGTMSGEGSGCGAVAACYPFCVLISLSVSFPRACLPRVVSRHQSDTDGGGGLRSIVSAGGLLACPVVSVPCRPFRLGSRPLHPMARSIDAALCRCPDVMA